MAWRLEGPKRIIEENGRSFDPSAPASSGLGCAVEEQEEELAEAGWTEKDSRRPSGRVGAFPNRRRRRRQASARPLVGPPNTLPVLSAPGWILMSLLNLAQSFEL